MRLVGLLSRPRLGWLGRRRVILRLPDTRPPVTTVIRRIPVTLVYPGYPGYPGYSGYQGHQAPGYQEPLPGRPTPRSAGQHSVAMTVIALGSMTLGVAATAIVAHARGGGQAVMVFLIWAAIAIVNIAYARRC